MRPRLPVTAIVAGGPAAVVEATLAALAGQSRPCDVWLLQAPRDEAVDRLIAQTTALNVRVVRADDPFSPWAPLMFAWFAPTAAVLLSTVVVPLDPRFLAVAHTMLLRRRGAVCSAGDAAVGPDGLSVDAASAAIAGGACLIATEWIRHAWARPPGDLRQPPGPRLAAGLRNAGIPIFVADLRTG